MRMAWKPRESTGSPLLQAEHAGLCEARFHTALPRTGRRETLIRLSVSWIQGNLRWRALMAAALVLGSAWILVSRAPASATTAGRIPSPREGFSAPDFTLDQLNGGSLTLSGLRGKVVVVNLWASWCPPCRAEMPALEQVYQEISGEGVEFLAVNTTYQDSLSEVASFVDRYGLSFPILIDPSGEVARQYQLRALPSTFFIDADGVIRKVVIGGPMRETTIRTAVAELLDERR